MVSRSLIYPNHLGEHLKVQVNGLDWEVSIPLEKARVLAFLNIPTAVSAPEARGWVAGYLFQQHPNATVADLDFICYLHTEDEVLRGWRAGEMRVGSVLERTSV
ncbi:TPA_asm: hypothetical protein [ssRNA phage Zoerhiza.2_20]|uniref:Uncharacterized protein n=2 Tax=Leviviricetes TaxID=2842243 RepID=A0A8S5L1S0_9VIRU|nr:hypothetical protein QIO60_gp3 [ssRNA phage Zoerhiza.2_20]QDH89237.1 MAG: hypothetical protein H2Rhizo33304_000002 [Leviviridae sp.]DAD51388.1 TPA_asm: hypothetical protein [ssRNA phage Zoerhiza.2_20]